VAAGKDPFAMMADAMAAAAQELGTFRLRADKRAGSYNDLLGWCTWDAFYHEVDQQKVLDGLASFAEAGSPIGFCIVDDGWMDVRGDYLHDVGVNAEKCPQGLSGLARNAKNECGLVGLFHCSDNDEPITDTCKASDVHDLPGSNFAAWSYGLGQMWTLQPDQPIERTLGPARSTSSHSPRSTAGPRPVWAWPTSTPAPRP